MNDLIQSLKDWRDDILDIAWGTDDPKIAAAYLHCAATISALISKYQT